jgi:lysophospholipase L1-like esterase
MRRSLLRTILLKGKTALAGPVLPAALTYASRFVQLGDSITQYGAALSTSLLSYSMAGELESAASILGSLNFDIWGSDAATNPGWFGGDMGIAGQTLTTIGLRSPDANALLPDAMIIAGGTNDNVGIGNYQATADAYTAMAVSAHDAGVKHVFIRSIWPKGPTQSTGTTVADQRRYNAALKAFCDANATWCHYINVFDAVTNADGTPKTGYLLPDDLHPSALGGFMSGVVVAATIQAVMDATKDSSWLVDNFWATGNIIASGSLPGTVAASGTGISGNLPTGWSAALSGSPTSTVAFSLVSNPDTGGQSLVMDITPGTGTGSDILTISLPSLTPTANQWYKPWMEFELGAGSRNPQLEIINGVVNPDNPVTSVRTIFGDLATIATGKIKAVAPPIQSRATATVPKIILTIDRGRSAFQTKIHRVYMGPVTDPHITWGQTSLPVNSVAPSVSGTPGLGNVLTIASGTWSGLTSLNTSARAFQFNMYRDGIFVSSTYGNGNLAYTQVAADAGSVLSWTVGASNMAKGRSDPVAASNSVNVARSIATRSLRSLSPGRPSATIS